MELHECDARQVAFRAASYYRAADFFLHGDPADPRITSIWASATDQFNQAIALLTPAGERLTIEADGLRVPAILYRAASGTSRRPTILMFNGFDGSQEEMLHICGFAALERGFNVLTFEGPGQPTVVREQELGFRHDWEQVVTPVADACEAHHEIDASRLGLIALFWRLPGATRCGVRASHPSGRGDRRSLQRARGGHEHPHTRAPGAV